MEEIVVLHGSKQNSQFSVRKYLPSGSTKDPWLVVREGSVADVDASLALLKKNGGNINTRNAFGLTLLHIATWRNHVPIVRRLLEAGADPNARDGESGWTSLHRALHFGYLAVASVLLQEGASITSEDFKSRTPVDLLSGPVLQTLGNEENSATELFSWGSGVNYQLGTGNAHIQKLPCKVDSLHGSFIKLVSAAKFHSVAVSAKGEVYTWGYGRGGRLGHPDFDIHSGQAAVITPRKVTSGLGSRRVKAIAAAKHHTVVATEGGEVFTWGSNREGQLGYTSVDSQATPRRVSSLKSKIVAVAAANKHTAVVSESGEVFTWGCNKDGQLGYGTSNSGWNYTPRVVEYLKGKVFVGVAAAKYHTIVLGVDGEVFTWGHRLVTPRRVVIARNIKKIGSTPLKFHRKERLHVVSIAAGMVHSMALTDDGAVFCWLSSDPNLRCRQLYSLCGRTMVSISAGKYWTAAVTATGDVYRWDGKDGKDEQPVATRLHGAKKASSVSVGETHLLFISSLYHPTYPPSVLHHSQNLKLKVDDELEELEVNFVYDDAETDNALFTIQEENTGTLPVPSLKSLCEKVAAEFLVEPHSAIQLLEIADSLGADDLRKHCEDIVIRNLDYILTVSTHAVATASLDILASLEKSRDLKSSELWSYRRLPTPTATFPAVINSEEEDNEDGFIRTSDNHNKLLTSMKDKYQRLDNFLHPDEDVNQGICRQVRALRKKLQQIEILEEKQANGFHLDNQQIAKIQTRSSLESSLAELGSPVSSITTKAASPINSDGKANKKVEASRKQRRKSKHKVTEAEVMSGNDEIHVEANPVKGFSPLDISWLKQKEDAVLEVSVTKQVNNEESFIQKGFDNMPSKISSPAASKKKKKKGGLSMFLSGALDDSPKVAVPSPPTPKVEGPAWGGNKISKGRTSLRDIQDEQSKTMEYKTTRNKDQVDEHSKTKEYKPFRNKDQVEDPLDGKSGGKVLLSSFLPSTPIPMVSPGAASQVPDGERGTPPWASSGTPPLMSRPSLRDIQWQQHGKQQQSLAHSPKTRTTGFSVNTSPTCPSDSAVSNKWFKPEVDVPSSIRSIQIEERAMKDLKRFYSNVKLVKNQS
ncbi:uncharacterized protein LOC108227552 isoform X2 [Daucus carota subsp. sativus]|uniref:uncharacterized protein LOC108227552 isoform X2 n=1 Tax=Daucus carota subsp. sativus TaxID=79200 RepID=UPI0007EFDEB6|nr:PREDICTED: uncharacterized protein LOC108227552 isoform X2 [Daucus carota subsp. sativus]